MGEDITLRFLPNTLNEEQVKLIKAHRDAFTKLAKKLDEELPSGRLKAITLTKLEEAAMFSTKSISHG